MPRDKSIKKVLIIGSGPIVIGQAAEFDYAGTQACRVLKDEGVKVVLVNSNPATIMTDQAIADHIYIEPLTINTIKRIIRKERPDSILSGLGGQTGLTLSMQLAKDGFLDEMGVRLLGSSPETIDKAEDRQIFKDTMEAIDQPCIPSKVVTDVEAALAFADEIGYPVIVRPAFTLGGSGGGICDDREELERIATGGLELSPIHQVLIEKGIAGWKEIEFEVMRDSRGTAVTICSMENFDPVGIHTGDSIVAAPAVSLSTVEYNMLHEAALKIVDALGVEGGCNCQFALHPTSMEYAVIEVNPRVSRSSALASKATGYPIAKVSTKIALGYTLEEIENAVTGKTTAAFEPTIDYIAVKFPKWPFDKFIYAKRDLGTQMKATGEVMSIADTFEAALMKAVRGVEIGLDCMVLPKLANWEDDALWKAVEHATDERIFVLAELLRRDASIESLYEITRIDPWFLHSVDRLIDMEKRLQAEDLNNDLYEEAKIMGYPDTAIARLSGKGLPALAESMRPVYKMVDTCAAEFEAQTPYFYSQYGRADSGLVNEANDFLQASDKEKILVLGSGPIRIGQGIEFDYASVHAVWALREAGYEVVVINNNPETVSTDFDTADRLYFEPLYLEDVMHIINMEKPLGVIVAFGGGTAIKLTQALADRGVRILGSSAEAIDICEDRERFDGLLEELQIKRPRGAGVTSLEEALETANELGYPVLLRPSYVIGGQNMIIAFSDDDVREYMAVILSQKQENPVLIDQYLSGQEIEVDAICDSEDVLIPGIMEHVERTGVHSGDSIAVYPAMNIDDDLAEKIFDTTKRICLALEMRGLVNIQYIVIGSEIYVIEVNPRASRTVPYLSKVTGIPMTDLATKVSLGTKVNSFGFGTGIYPVRPYVAVKVPVFSFEKLTDLDTQLGPEMKSTGEVLGLGKNLEEALVKGLLAAGYTMNRSGGVLISVKNSDKRDMLDIAKKFNRLGFRLYATEGTAKAIQDMGIAVTVANKISENPDDNLLTLLNSGKISYVLSTSTRGRDPQRDSVKIRRKAISLGIPCLTSIDTANALADSLKSRYTENNTELIDIDNMRETHENLQFSKMETLGNDYIIFNCFTQKINSPESLSVYLLDRHFGVGGDGIILILPSQEADVKIRMFNYDGSEGRMFGNALNCVAKYLYDKGIIKKRKMRIETVSGIRHLAVKTTNDKVSQVQVQMGMPEFRAQAIPAVTPRIKMLGESIEVAGETWTVTCLSLGNPHCIIFSEATESLAIEEIGKEFQKSDIFPEGVNVSFVKQIDDETLQVRFYERGNGATFSCGSCSCAAVIAGVENGLLNKAKDIRVMAPGGELHVRYIGNEVYLLGTSQMVFEGTVEI